MLYLVRKSSYFRDYPLFVATCNADIGMLFKVKKILEYYLVEYEAS
jgi:hypothetical protein